MSGHVTFLMCGRRFPLANSWGRNHCPQSSPMTVKGLKVQVFTRKRKMTTAAILKRVSIRTPEGFDQSINQPIRLSAAFMAVVARMTSQGLDSSRLELTEVTKAQYPRVIATSVKGGGKSCILLPNLDGKWKELRSQLPLCDVD